jgi:hypothetical protein
MRDPTETIRRALVAEINHNPNSREALEAKHGKVWDTREMITDFSVSGFATPFVVVTRNSDGAKGSLTFQHNPRFYFSFRAEEGA